MKEGFQKPKFLKEETSRRVEWFKSNASLRGVWTFSGAEYIVLFLDLAGYRCTESFGINAGTLELIEGLQVRQS